jgi:hypothetical protein
MVKEDAVGCGMSCRSSERKIFVSPQTLFLQELELVHITLNLDPVLSIEMVISHESESR